MFPSTGLPQWACGVGPRKEFLMAQRGQGAKPAPTVLGASPGGTAEPTTLSPRPDGPAKPISHGEPGVLAAELDRFGFVVRERLGQDGTVSRMLEVREEGKALWRLSEQDLDHLATFTGQIDRGLTL